MGAVLSYLMSFMSLLFRRWPDAAPIDLHVMFLYGVAALWCFYGRGDVAEFSKIVSAE